MQQDRYVESQTRRYAVPDLIHGFKTNWQPVLQDESAGQGLVEYVLIVGFISIVVIAALIYFRMQLVPLYSTVGNSLT